MHSTDVWGRIDDAERGRSLVVGIAVDLRLAVREVRSRLFEMFCYGRAGFGRGVWCFGAVGLVEVPQIRRMTHHPICAQTEFADKKEFTRRERVSRALGGSHPVGTTASRH